MSESIAFPPLGSALSDRFLSTAEGIPCGFNQLQATPRGLMIYPRFDTGLASGSYGEYAENDFAILSQLVQEGQTVVELGAHAGAYTLFLAQQVGPSGVVMAWEGQRILFQALCGNMALNGISQTHCCQWIAGEHADRLKMPFVDYYAPHNFSAIEPSSAGKGEEVQQVALDDLQLQQCHLLKINAGFRTLEVLQGAAQTIQRLQPALYIDWTHGDGKPGMVFSCIKSMGYDAYWSIAPVYHQGQSENPAERSWDKSELIVNLLCVPQNSDFSLQGFTPITGATDDWRTVLGMAVNPV